MNVNGLTGTTIAPWQPWAYPRTVWPQPAASARSFRHEPQNPAKNQEGGFINSVLMTGDYFPSSEVLIFFNYLEMQMHSTPFKWPSKSGLEGKRLCPPVLWIRNYIFFLSDPDCLWKIHLNCKSFLDPDCLWKVHLNRRSSKYRQKTNFLKSVPVHFYNFVLKQYLSGINYGSGS